MVKTLKKAIEKDPKELQPGKHTRKLLERMDEAERLDLGLPRRPRTTLRAKERRQQVGDQ